LSARRILVYVDRADTRGVSAEIRNLVPEDAPVIAGIYNDAVSKRLATFDESPTSVAEMEADLRASLSTHPGLAIVMESVVIGYTVSSPHSSYEPYRGIAEFSVYVSETYRGHGFGRVLLAELVARCRDAGFDKLLSRILAENAASRALCASLGFREVGTYERHARLDGAWRDVVIVERLLEQS
jgi:L-amino acid N-acyltransferase YncA